MNLTLPLTGLAFAAVAASMQFVQAAAPALFGSAEYRQVAVEALPQWQRALEQVETEQETYRACAKDPAQCASHGLASWQLMIRRLEDKPSIQQISILNGFINQWTYRTDSQNYGKSDYWASPTEFFARSGDCEDYAIAKYVSLRQLGFSADQLRLVVVKDTQRQLAHAVLAVYIDQTVLILDNLTNDVTPHQEIATYIPYYSVNEDGRWIHLQPVALDGAQKRSLDQQALQIAKTAARP